MTDEEKVKMLIMRAMHWRVVLGVREFGLLCGERQVHSGHVQGWPPTPPPPHVTQDGKKVWTALVSVGRG